jgi:hypothetical protein
MKLTPAEASAALLVISAAAPKLEASDMTRQDRRAVNGLIEKMRLAASLADQAPEPQPDRPGAFQPARTLAETPMKGVQLRKGDRV